MNLQDSLARFSDITQNLKTEIAKAVIGQTEVVDLVLTSLYAGGHVLVEGLPGLGKTLLIRTLAKTISGSSSRIQFTPDLMPSDITGHVMFDMGSGKFRVRRGPVFTNFLLADEINRAPAKTQAALLEVMQEKQVSLDGKTLGLEPPFFTMATQNPFEHEGTYPLPDAQLDRFIIKINILYPSLADEAEMVTRILEGHVGDNLELAGVKSVTDLATIVKIQETAAKIQVDERVVGYAVKIVTATRKWPGISVGAGPRGSLALIRTARAMALMEGMDFITPDHVKAMVLPVLRHRISLSPELEIEGQQVDNILTKLTESVHVPRL